LLDESRIAISSYFDGGLMYSFTASGEIGGRDLPINIDDDAAQPTRKHIVANKILFFIRSPIFMQWLI
jgi:hypothetical protein